MRSVQMHELFYTMVQKAGPAAVIMLLYVSVYFANIEYLSA